MKIFKKDNLVPVLVFLAVALSVAGFIVPPIGVIDGSVLTAMGIILFLCIVSVQDRRVDSLNRQIQIKDYDYEMQKGLVETLDSLRKTYRDLAFGERSKLQKSQEQQDSVLCDVDWRKEE